MDWIKVHIFRTGKVQVDRAILLHENNPLAVLGQGVYVNRDSTMPEQQWEVDL